MRLWIGISYVDDSKKVKALDLCRHKVKVAPLPAAGVAPAIFRIQTEAAAREPIVALL